MLQKLRFTACLLAIAALACAAEKPKFEAFEYRDVKLLPGLLHDRFRINREYLLSLPTDSLLYPYYKEAVIKVPNDLKPLGGWEAPTIDIRGHFLGHYLSACARIIGATGDAEIKSKADHVVAELARCQKANGNGYVGPISERVFAVLESGRHSDVWAPYYVIHKPLMGLYEMYRHAGNQQALAVARGLADYIKARIDRLPDSVMTRSLEVEHGGMTEVLYDLSAATGDAKYRDLARRFEHSSILGPLAANEDKLTGLHTNTQIPKIYGAARAYELTGDPRYFTISRNFWDLVTRTRTYATGGTSDKEYWPAADRLARSISEANQETCTAYNMIWLSRYLLRWTADAKYGDYIERNTYNGIVTAQNPEDGQFCYFTPLKPGSFKKFGTALGSFWCCYGTGVQAFSDLSGGIYYRDETGIVVDQFVPSEVVWRRGSGIIKLVQETKFPEQGVVRITVHTASPTSFALRVRIPGWAKKGIDAKITGAAARDASAVTSASPGSYLSINRTWTQGDSLEIRMSMNLTAEPLKDDPELVAFLYGPLALAGLTLEDVALKGKRSQPETWIAEVAEKDWVRTWRVPRKTNFLPEYIDYTRQPVRTFATAGPNPIVKFVPLYAVVSEPYGVYFRVRE